MKSKYCYYQPNEHQTETLNVRDDAVRAFARAMSMSWVNAYDTLCDAGRKCGDMLNSIRSVKKALKAFGFSYEKANCKSTVAALSEKYANKIVVCYCSGYFVTSVNGCVYDSRQESLNYRVSAYFIK